MCSPESDGRWRRWSPCRQQLLVCSGCGKSCCNITQLRGAQLASNTLSHKYDTAIMRVEVEVVLCLPSLHSSAVLRAWERWTRTPGHRPLYKHADINSAACCGHSFLVLIKQIDRDRPKLWLIIDAFAVSQRTSASIIWASTHAWSVMYQWTRQQNIEYINSS